MIRFTDKRSKRAEALNVRVDTNGYPAALIRARRAYPPANVQRGGRLATAGAEILARRHAPHRQRSAGSAEIRLARLSLSFSLARSSRRGSRHPRVCRSLARARTPSLHRARSRVSVCGYIYLYARGRALYAATRVSEREREKARDELVFSWALSFSLALLLSLARAGTPPAVPLALLFSSFCTLTESFRILHFHRVILSRVFFLTVFFYLCIQCYLSLISFLSCFFKWHIHVQSLVKIFVNDKFSNFLYFYNYYFKVLLLIHLIFKNIILLKYILAFFF